MYVGLRKYSTNQYVIYKLTKADGNVFTASISLTSKIPDSTIEVSNDSHVILCWSYGENYDAVTRIYNSEGAEIRKIVHSNRIGLNLLKSNGHMLNTDRFCRSGITKIEKANRDGEIVKQYSVSNLLGEYFLDKYDRLIVCNIYGTFQILDSELNYSAEKLPIFAKLLNPMHCMRYHPVKNEIFCLTYITYKSWRLTRLKLSD